MSIPNPHAENAIKSLNISMLVIYKFNGFQTRMDLDSFNENKSSFYMTGTIIVLIDS